MMTTKNPALVEAFCTRLNEALDKAGIPPRNRGRIQFVSEMFLLSHAGAGKWVNGISLPARNKRKEIAARLNVNYEWLEFGKGSRDPTVSKADGVVRHLPILGFHEAANFDRITKDFIGETLEADVQAGDRAFVLFNQGTAMLGRFPENTILIFDPDLPIKDGDYVLTKIAQLPDCVFRQLVVSSSGKKFLYPHDSRYKTHELRRNDQIIAKLVQARMNY